MLPIWLERTFFEFCGEYTVAGQILGCVLYFNMDGKSTIFKVYNRTRCFSGMKVPCLYIHDVHKSL